MKKILTTKSALFSSLLGTLFFFSPVVFYKIFDCYNNDNTLCSTSYQRITTPFVLFIFVIIFSLITYKMRDEIFEHWIKFAKWGVPVLMILTYLMLGNTRGGGYLGMEKDFMAFLFILLYGAFCGISIWRIVSKYRELKGARE